MINPTEKPNAGDVYFHSSAGKLYHTVWGETFSECKKIIRNFRWYTGVQTQFLDDAGKIDGLKYMCVCPSDSMTNAIFNIMRPLR